MLEKECCKHISAIAKISETYDNNSLTTAVLHESNGAVIELADVQYLRDDELNSGAACHRQLPAAKHKTPIYLANQVLII